MLATEYAPCCATPVNTAVPGPQGATGTSGVNAWTALTQNFLIPLAATPNTMNVVTTAGFIQNQNIFCGGANFIIVSILSGTQLSVQTVLANGDVATPNIIPSGSQVVGSLGNIQFPLSLTNGGTGAKTAADALAALGLGGLALPVPVASGGTGSTTADNARTALGFGKAICSTYVTGSSTQIATTTSGAASSISTGIAVTLTDALTYRIYAACRLDGSGATVSANATLGIKLRKTSGSAADLTNAAATAKLPAATTLSHTFAYLFTPVVTFAAAANDIITIFAQSSASTSAGNIQAVDGWIIAVPQY